MSQGRTFSGTVAPWSMGPRRMTKPMAKFSGKMSVVAKAASVGDLAERLACVQQRPAMQKKRGVIQTKRIDEFTARRPRWRKELLKVT